jgi:hypothetical protein
MTAIAVVGVLAGVVALGFELTGQPGVREVGFGRWGPYALAAASLVWLVPQAASLRHPPGLTLDASGLSGVRGSKRVALPWDDLDGVSLQESRGAMLVLEPHDAAPIVIDARWIGSDANLVAAIIEHFRAQRTDRAALDEGPSALRLAAVD